MNENNKEKEKEEKTYPFKMGWQITGHIKKDEDVDVLKLIKEGLEYYKNKYEEKANRVSVSQKVDLEKLDIEGVEFSTDKQIYTTKIIYIWREEDDKNA